MCGWAGDTVLFQHPVPGCQSWGAGKRNSQYPCSSLCGMEALEPVLLWAARVTLCLLLALQQIMAVLEESSYLHCPEHLGPSQPAVSLVSLSREFNISLCCSKDEWLWWDHILCLTEHASGERGIRETRGAAAARHGGVSCIAKPYPDFFLGEDWRD